MVEAQLVQFESLPRDTTPRRYTGALTTVGRENYVWEWCPTHPKADFGMVLQHSLVMECILGRFLTKLERVHHRDHNRQNNEPGNLELFANQADHMREHWKNKGSRDPALIQKVREVAGNPFVPASALGISPTTLTKILEEHPDICWFHRRNGIVAGLSEERVREALQGRSVVEAAALLGVHSQTLYNRFDHLLQKRASPGSLDAHKEKILAQIYKERRPKHEIAEEYGVSRQCVIRSVQRWRREDAKQGGPDLPELPRLKPGPKPSRTEQDKAEPSKERAEALGESVLGRLRERFQLAGSDPQP